MRHKTNTKWGWGLFRRSLSQCRNGRGMNGMSHDFIWTVSANNYWSIGPRKELNIHSRNFLWSFIWKEGRTLFSKTTNKFTRYNRFFKYISLRIIKVKGAINVRRKRAHRESPPMGYGHYEAKGLVCSVLGNGIRSWSFNSSTLY